ncbi:MAG: xanthine dehydrogenase family protein molybdopterin-binding subunit [Chthonomonadaceae bacterium]|nr:xanthine dehydrogenase family protein molybdopterin-binding subunit [Chthonomonadaceae bacterium]
MKSSRREFLKVSVAAGGGMVLTLACRNVAKASGSDRLEESHAVNPFVQLSTDGTVTVTISKPDMGQGVRTSLAMIVAEEMGVDWASVKVVQAPGDRTVYGSQGVGGSGSVRGSYMSLRRTGAAAAIMVKSAAAQAWGVEASACKIEGGKVVCGSKSASIGEFAQAAAGLTPPDPASITLKDPSTFKIIGTPRHRVDNLDIVTGKGHFGLDAKVEGMLHAVVARPKAIGAKAVSFSDTESKKVPGFVQAHLLGSGVAVVAKSTWAAIKARDVLKVEWTAGVDPTLTSDSLEAALTKAGVAFPNVTGAKTIEATYTLPFLSHAPMEPMNCLADVRADSCDIWVPTQVPDGVRDMVARKIKLAPSSVKVNVTLLGGGFGRRLLTDYVDEAVAISQTVGKPVQLIWTRDDDIRHDRYRPASLHAMKGGVDASGTPIAMYHQVMLAGDDPSSQWKKVGLSYQMGECQLLESGAACPVPTFAWRSVENTYMNLVRECFFDELCAAGGQDPVKARLALITNNRLKGTLEECASRAGWGKPLAKGTGRGVACFAGYGSYITQIAEVTLREDSTLKVTKVTAVVDCGLAINPLGVAAQIEGATMDGLATTLYSAITLNDGEIEQSGLAAFGWARMEDSPTIEVHVISGGDSPGGIGEVGFPAAGPAILNAIFAATGQRLRKLPVGNTVA